MRYEEPQPIEFSEAEEYMASRIPTVIADTLVRASLSPIDPDWVEAASRRSLEHEATEVRWAALTALQNLVRRYRGVDVDNILKAVKALGTDPVLSGKVEDLLDDIQIYLDSQID